MTRDEVKQLLAKIRSVYPDYRKGQSNADITATIDSWHMVMADYDAAFIEGGLKRVFSSSRFSPSPAEVIDAARGHQKEQNGNLILLGVAEMWKRGER